MHKKSHRNNSGDAPPLALTSPHDPSSGVPRPIAEEHPSFYAVIPAAVRYDEHLSDKAKLLYGEIAALTNREGFCWACNGYFARHFKASKRAISKWVAQLQRRGFIRVEVLHGNQRRIWLSHPGKKASPTNKRSGVMEPAFVGDRTAVPSPYNIKENNKRNTHSGSPRSDGQGSAEGHPGRQEFLELWSAAYEDFFGDSYKVSGIRDARAADSLLVLKNANPDSLIEVARKAWIRRTEFNCKHAVSLSGFASRFNEIRGELGLLKKASEGRGPW